MSDIEYTSDEIMSVVAARSLRDGQVCFVGIGLPSEAANLARLSHAPEVILIYESGTIGTRPDVLPLSIGDGELADRADLVVSVPEVFAYWLQAGRVDVGISLRRADRSLRQPQQHGHRGLRRSGSAAARRRAAHPRSRHRRER